MPHRVHTSSSCHACCIHDSMYPSDELHLPWQIRLLFTATEKVPKGGDNAYPGRCSFTYPSSIGSIISQSSGALLHPKGREGEIPKILCRVLVPLVYCILCTASIELAPLR